ncbi:winged helix-turn-helix transcriptional regulator [Chitinophaga sp. Hz27]|uniref:winged helix-turn-helix transcriptional regulator n=1 Tax=Chitinophaga sp. Hz27 TaxID=3347169 RepID=UPI0035E11E18
MKKENSTNSINARQLRGDCGTVYTLSLIGGRWKPVILWRLLAGKMRYTELRKSINGISERVLVLQLREMETDGLIQRAVYPEVPPRVEYEITALGASMEPILEIMSDWGIAHMPEEVRHTQDPALQHV